nr:hypothetical protein [Acetobacter persici]
MTDVFNHPKINAILYKINEEDLPNIPCVVLIDNISKKDILVGCPAAPKQWLHKYVHASNMKYCSIYINRNENPVITFQHIKDSVQGISFEDGFSFRR